MNPIIEPGGVEVLYYTVRSCGHDWAGKLRDVRGEVALLSLGELGKGSEIVRNLANFAETHKIGRLSQEDVLRYFVTDHLGDANRSAMFDPDKLPTGCGLVGKLLANCALWPLDEDLILRLPERSINIKGFRDAGGSGLPFLHRDLVFRLPVPPKIHARLHELLLSHKLFLASVSCIGSEISFPILPEATK